MDLGLVNPVATTAHCHPVAATGDMLFTGLGWPVQVAKPRLGSTTTTSNWKSIARVGRIQSIVATSGMATFLIEVVEIGTLRPM